MRLLDLDLLQDVYGEGQSLNNASPQLVVTGQYGLGDIRHNRADITRLSALLDYRPRVGLAEGLPALRRLGAQAAATGRPARCRQRGAEREGDDGMNRAGSVS